MRLDEVGYYFCSVDPEFDPFSGKRKGSPGGESTRESKRGRDESEAPEDDDEGNLLIFYIDE